LAPFSASGSSSRRSWLIVYTAATFALVLWAWNHVGVLQSQPGDARDPDGAGGQGGRAAFKAFLLRNGALLVGLAVLLLGVPHRLAVDRRIRHRLERRRAGDPGLPFSSSRRRSAGCSSKIAAPSSG